MELDYIGPEFEELRYKINAGHQKTEWVPLAVALRLARRKGRRRRLLPLHLHLWCSGIGVSTVSYLRIRQAERVTAALHAA